MSSIIHIEETASTNSYLKELLLTQNIAEGTIVFAHHQTAGRGQRGNSWEAEEGKNLTFSMVLYPTFVIVKEQFILSQLVSLGIKAVLDKYTSHITIKWPNDIYWRDQKICGILIENTLGGGVLSSCVIGIGINVNQTEFLSDAPNPVSLKMITGKDCLLEELLVVIRDRILGYYRMLRGGDEEFIVKAYKSSLFRKEGYYRYSDREKEFDAKIVDVRPSGHLVLETLEGEIRTFAFREVKYVL